MKFCHNLLMKKTFIILTNFKFLGSFIFDFLFIFDLYQIYWTTFLFHVCTLIMYVMKGFECDTIRKPKAPLR